MKQKFSSGKHVGLRAAGWLCALALVFTHSAFAKEKIAVFAFQKSAGVSDDVRNQVEQFVLQALVDEQRFEVLERSQFAALEAERNFQTAMSDQERQAIDELGARFTVIGTVNQSSMERRSLNNGVAYDATIGYGLRIVDVSTGKVAYSGEFSSSTGNLGDVFSKMFQDSTSAGGALRSALKTTEKTLAKFIDQSFPIFAKVISIERSNRRGEALEVLISGGPADGIGKKTELVTFLRSEIEVDGEVIVRERVLGALKVVRDEGQKLSICKVRSGGKALAEAIAAGNTVHVKVKS